MTTKQILGNDFDSFIALIKRFISLSSESATQIETNPYAARNAIKDAQGILTENVQDIKELLAAKESIQLVRLKALKDAKQKLRDFDGLLEIAIKQEEDSANALIAEIEAI